MAAIASYGAYVPLWRLSRDVIASAWDRASTGGERSVANHDEDVVTMAVEAVSDCLSGFDRDAVDGLYFATTTSPFREKLCSSLVAEASDFKKEIITADFGNSLRAGTIALKAALDAVNSGSARAVVVVASDCRLAYPKSDHEQNFGDGAAAFLISSEAKPIATIEGHASICNELYDMWRLDKDTYVQSWEERFVVEHGYLANVQDAVSRLLQRHKLDVSSISKFVLYAPHARAHQQLAKNLGIDLKSQLQDLLVNTLGVCGCAHSLLMLVAAIEGAKAGDSLLAASYGDGCDAILLRPAAGIDEAKSGRRGAKGYLASKKSLGSYQKFLSYRGLLEPQPGEPFRLLPSATFSWRESNSTIRLHGSKCRNCGTVTFPVQRICSCLSKDNYDEVRLSDKRGKVFTFSLDNLAGRSDSPVVPQIVVESDLAQTRIYSLMTDCEPMDIKVGMHVEMTFRRMYEGGGMYNYYWKC